MASPGNPSRWLDRSASLFVLLVLLMLLPAAAVLWFTNEAVATQSAAARHSVMEAYRGQLRLVRARIDAHWRAHAAGLDGTDDPERRFGRLILEGAADGLVLLNADGGVAYPDAAPRRGPAVAAAEQRLAAVERLEPGAARDRAVEDMAAILNDYTAAMSGSERLLLMERLRTRAPNVRLPTEAALRLSLTVARGGRPAPVPGHFQPTAIRDVWAFASDDAQVIALYWTGRLEAMMHDLLHQVTPAGIRFVAFPPDVAGDPEAIAAGASLPGWQLSFHPLDMTPFDTAARRQVVLYVSAAATAIAAMALIGLIAARTFQRHLRLARLKTDLVATVSHELRTPVASMRVLVDGLLADEALDPVKTREYLELLAGENARLGRLIENFLTFARLERGRHQFAFAPVHPAAIVAAAADAIRERLPPDCEFQIEVEPDLPPLVADGEALVTALVNLLDNALKYTTGEKRILLRACREADAAVTFAVGDNGIGIPSREQRRIFRRFYRVDQRLARQTAGVGLGLSIVELIVRAHGGTVGVQSEAGAGSTFTLRLPAAQGVTA